MKIMKKCKKCNCKRNKLEIANHKFLCNECLYWQYKIEKKLDMSFNRC